MTKLYKGLSKPYLIWLMIFVFVPTFILLIVGFTNLTNSLDFENFKFTFNNVKTIVDYSSWEAFTNSAAIKGFKNSLYYATLTTVISIVLGYILAYIIYRSSFRNKFIIMVIMILPMWSNLILKLQAYADIMKTDNILIDLIGFSFLQGTYQTPIGILIGMVFTYIPFMILPIYTALEKIDENLYEASTDLGLPPFKTFLHVTFPLSVKGIVSGSIMVFLPTFSGFIIPDVLAGRNMNFIGKLIEQAFTYTGSFFNGALLSMFVLLFIFASMYLLRKFDKEGETLL